MKTFTGNNINNENIPVFILCGGLGTRFREQTEILPKPMISIGGKPILWHIMKYYSFYGFKKFVLCVGYKSEIIKSYFLNYASLNSDFTIKLSSNELTVHSIDHNEDWEVTIAYTGELTMTGARIKIAAEKYLGEAQNFCVTYGDGLTNADIKKELEFHLNHGKTGTILGINPPSRFGELKVNDNKVIEFEEKPDFKDKWINGGYFIFKRDFLKYLSYDKNCVLEKKPLVEVVKDGELMIYKHTDFWACMDTQRDWEYLSKLWKENKAPWAVWKD
jgi:glucose-1-phosphate cytidylyltransferase